MTHFRVAFQRDMELRGNFQNKAMRLKAKKKQSYLGDLFEFGLELFEDT